MTCMIDDKRQSRPNTLERNVISDMCYNFIQKMVSSSRPKASLIF